MAEKGFIRENAVPIIVTLFVIAAGTYLLSQQGYFAKEASMGSESMVFKNMKLKIFIEPDGTPKLFAHVPDLDLMDVEAFSGDSKPSPGKMVVGFDEAGMMASAFNLTAQDILWGYSIPDFFGAPIKVTGTLKRTGTMLDMVHLMTKADYDLRSGQDIGIKFTAEDMPKFFYYVSGDLSNWPKKAGNFSSGSIEDFKQREISGKSYLPVVLGSDEAKMMIDEGLISGTGAKIEGFFGKDVFIAGILAPTNSSLDMLHYMLA